MLSMQLTLMKSTSSQDLRTTLSRYIWGKVSTRTSSNWLQNCAEEGGRRGQRWGEGGEGEELVLS